MQQPNICIFNQVIVADHLPLFHTRCHFLQLSAERQSLADELSQLHTSHKQLQEQKEALDTELGSLKPAHAELQQMHNKASSELQSTKEALQKSQEARVRAEVRAAGNAGLSLCVQSSHSTDMPSVNLACVIAVFDNKRDCFEHSHHLQAASAYFAANVSDSSM
jgi:septal ring factor EnvC (AmiA/AmiB activator)